MSNLDSVVLDADGFIDMEQFADDGTELGDADLASLHDALRADPVDEPSADAWDALVDDVVATEDADIDASAFAHDGPFPTDGAAEDHGDRVEIQLDDAGADAEPVPDEPVADEADADGPGAEVSEPSDADPFGIADPELHQLGIDASPDLLDDVDAVADGLGDDVPSSELGADGEL